MPQWWHNCVINAMTVGHEANWVKWTPATHKRWRTIQDLFIPSSHIYKFQWLTHMLKQVKYQQSEVLFNNLKYAVGLTKKDYMIIWKYVNAQNTDSLKKKKATAAGPDIKRWNQHFWRPNLVGDGIPLYPYIELHFGSLGNNSIKQQHEWRTSRCCGAGTGHPSLNESKSYRMTHFCCTPPSSSNCKVTVLYKLSMFNKYTGLSQLLLNCLIIIIWPVCDRFSCPWLAIC